MTEYTTGSMGNFQGIHFQITTAMKMLLKVEKEEFEMGLNDKKSEPFDTIFFHKKTSDGKFKYHFKLSHLTDLVNRSKFDENKISSRDLFNLLAPKDSLREIVRENEEKGSKTIYILYSNKDFDEKEDIMKVFPESKEIAVKIIIDHDHGLLLHFNSQHENKGGLFEGILKKQSQADDSTKKEIENFLKHFYIAVRQPSAKVTELICRRKFNELYGKQGDIRFSQFFTRIMNWRTVSEKCYLMNEKLLSGWFRQMEKPSLNFDHEKQDPTPNFYGRVELLEKIEQRTSWKYGKILVIYGDPGIGKTELVKEAMYRGDHYNEKVWIDARSERALQDSLERLKQQLEKTDETTPRSMDIIKYIYKRLRDFPGYIIFDGARKLKDVKEKLPSGAEELGLKNVLVTCKEADGGGEMYDMISVKIFEDEESKEYLKKCLGSGGSKDSGELIAVSKEARLPLVLHLISSFIKKTNCTIKKFKKSMDDAIQKMASMPFIAEEIRKIAVAYLITAEPLAAEVKKALCVIVYLGGYDIPVNLLKDDLYWSTEFKTVLEELIEFSLIRYCDSTEKLVSVSHASIKDITELFCTHKPDEFMTEDDTRNAITTMFKNNNERSKDTFFNFTEHAVLKIAITSWHEKNVDHTKFPKFTSLILEDLNQNHQLQQAQWIVSAVNDEQVQQEGNYQIEAAKIEFNFHRYEECYQMCNKILNELMSPCNNGTNAENLNTKTIQDFLEQNDNNPQIFIKAALLSTHIRHYIKVEVNANDARDMFDALIKDIPKNGREYCTAITYRAYANLGEDAALLISVKKELKNVLNILKDNLSELSVAYLWTKVLFSTVCQEQGDMYHAENDLQKVIKDLEVICGREDLRTLLARARFGSLLVHNGRATEAEILYAEILPKIKSHLGQYKYHPLFLESIRKQGEARNLRQIGRPSQLDKIVHL